MYLGERKQRGHLHIGAPTIKMAGDGVRFCIWALKKPGRVRLFCIWEYARGTVEVKI